MERTTLRKFWISKDLLGTHCPWWMLHDCKIEKLKDLNNLNLQTSITWNDFVINYGKTLQYNITNDPIKKKSL